MCGICGADCSGCGFSDKCKGCIKTNGNPFGDGCVAAEYIKAGGKEYFEIFKSMLIDEINALNIEGMPKITELYSLCGFYVNLAYPFPNGYELKILNENRIYLGNQVPCEFDDGTENGRCYGIVADKDFILISEYGVNGTMPEIVIYKRR